VIGLAYRAEKAVLQHLLVILYAWISVMFTGIIEEMGRIRRLTVTADGGEIAIAAEKSLDGLHVGESIAVNGVCLTVSSLERMGFAAGLSAETVRRTTLGRLAVGAAVNLERALRVDSRWGGHIVQGHIDGTGKLMARRVEGESQVLRFSYPPELARYIVLKGSIAVDGISLTVAGLNEHWFEVAVIPHTLTVTNLGTLRTGDEVNLEVDILAKYVERMLTAGQTERRSSTSQLTVEYLKELGY